MAGREARPPDVSAVGGRHGQGQDKRQQGAGPASVQPYASMTAAGRAAGRILPSFGVPHLVGEASRTVSSAATRLARTAGLTRRRVWSRPGRHHIEVHGVCQDGGNRLARQVEGALERLPGVAWARVNAPPAGWWSPSRPPSRRCAT